VISVNGGTDPDCGNLPDSAFTWTIDLVKDGGQSLQVNLITGAKNGSFPVPTTGYDFQGNAQYRITLTVTGDKSKSTSVVTISPQKVNLTFNTAPAGLTLNLDGKDRPAPFSIDALVGFRYSIEARNQTSGGTSFTFESWSDGKPQQHEIVVPNSNQTYTATYVAMSAVSPSKPVPPVQPGPIVFQQQNYSAPQTNQSAVSTAYTKGQIAGNTNIIAIGWRSAEGTISSVTDTVGNTYVLAAPLTRGQGNLSQAIYYAKNIAAAPAGNTVKVTFSGGRLGLDVRITEYSGLDPNNPVDVTSSSSGSSNSATSGSVTTTAANTLLFDSGISWSNYGKATNGFTTRVLSQPKLGGLGGTGIVADRSVSSVGTYAATAPVSGGGTWLMQLVAFKGVS
jgi:hypothetical protein